MHADGGIAYINIGDATRIVNGNFCLFLNHSRVIEHCEHIGLSTMPYTLWKKPTTKPKYKGKGAFLGSGFLQHKALTLNCEFIARATNMQTGGHKAIDQPQLTVRNYKFQAF